MKTIAVLVAMEEEREAVLEIYSCFAMEKKIILGKEIHEIRYTEGQIIIALTGVGKVNAAATLTLISHIYKPDYVINIGSAGGLKKEQNIFDIVVPLEIVYTDVDVQGLGYKYGQMYGEPERFYMDSFMHECFDTIVRENAIESAAVHKGLLGSADKFISQDEQLLEIEKHFSGEVVCVEMEAAAIAQLCHKFSIPCFILRSLSDVPCKGTSVIDFPLYVREAAKSSSVICKKMIDKICSI